MSEAAPSSSELTALERKVEALIGLCSRLSKENRRLAKEHHQLQRRNKQASEKIDSIIDHLKLLERK